MHNSNKKNQDTANKLRAELTAHVEKLYPNEVHELSERLFGLIHHYWAEAREPDFDIWNEQDVILITYGDSITSPDQNPLQTLHGFLNQYLSNTISGVHILPFFPYSSDDGFSVIDYRRVNPALGDWHDIRAIANEYRLMVDLVINHVSRESLWFYDFVADRPPANGYFIELDPETDLQMVTRPRSSPLLVPVNTHRGTRYLWATFSEDQIDLNFANSDVLLEMIEILLEYLSHGARLVRLDAIAFLWKTVGTYCIHLEETHEVVKLIRTVMHWCFPNHILLTETNVPHLENLSYFGDGNEAHMVYQFTLPPLILYTLNRGTAQHLTQWAMSLGELPPQCTYLNFTASHDGIGLRALEGILPGSEVDDLVDCMHRYGGFVSMKANANGKDTPYEVNISLFDAMQGTRRGPDQWQVPRFLCSQAMMLSLQGIPAVYIHSLLATANDLRGVEISGRTRSINRKKWNHADLVSLLEDKTTLNYEVFSELSRLIQIRRNESCFHPDCKQEILEISHGIFAVLRYGDNGQQLLALHNVSQAPQAIVLKNRPELTDDTQWYDLVTDKMLTTILPETLLQPYQVMWLSKKAV